MNYFCAKSNIKSKMFCTRIYEPNEFDDMNADEHLHCFILAYVNGKVYHIEHPNWYNIGIFQYDNEAEAIEKIQEYFNDISNGQARPLAQYNEEKVGCSFNEFNCYINSLKEYELKG